MKRCKIAGLTVDINYTGEMLESRIKNYLIPGPDEKEADITIDIPESVIEDHMKKSPASEIGYAGFEYILTGGRFYRTLINFDGFMLHSSAVVVDGNAYLFSAPCGTGKSTHTSLWEEYFKDRGAYVINDDKPAIRMEKDGTFTVYGTPWSGKTDKNRNTSAKLCGICFLERSEVNTIEKLPASQAMAKLVWQTTRPRDEETLAKLMSLLDKLLKEVSVYKMGCRIDYNAVETAYNAMKLKGDTK